MLKPLLCDTLQDMHKLMNKDKIILRFTARMTPGQSAVSHADAGGCLVVTEQSISCTAVSTPLLHLD